MLDVTSGDARSWYMISGDAKLWNGNQSQGYRELGLLPHHEEGRRAGRGGGRTGGRSVDQDDGRNEGQAQVGDQGRGQENGRNQNGDAANDNIRGNIEKMESVPDMSGCRDSQKVKYTPGSYVGKALTWWNSQIHTRGQEPLCRITPWSGLAMLRILISFISWLGMVAATEPKTIQKAVQIAGTIDPKPRLTP
ncbi:hypothetical protein Tco_0487790 [Tanacetum coccineum]